MHIFSGVNANSRLGGRSAEMGGCGEGVFPSPPEDGSGKGANCCFVISKWYNWVNSEVLSGST